MRPCLASCLKSGALNFFLYFFHLKHLRLQHTVNTSKFYNQGTFLSPCLRVAGIFLLLREKFNLFIHRSLKNQNLSQTGLGLIRKLANIHAQSFMSHPFLTSAVRGFDQTPKPPHAPYSFAAFLPSRYTSINHKCSTSIHMEVFIEVMNSFHGPPLRHLISLAKAH